jgi:hypothetical protein
VVSTATVQTARPVKAIKPLPPIANPDAWLTRAACAGMDTDIFFGQETAKARAICRGCPVRAACLMDAMQSPRIFGIWGGTSEKQRSTIRNRRAAS